MHYTWINTAYPKGHESITQRLEQRLKRLMADELTSPRTFLNPGECGFCLQAVAVKLGVDKSHQMYY